MAATSNTFKFSTLMWFLAGLIIPLWPLSLPICWIMAYRSYKNGDAPAGRLSDLQSAVELNKAGVLSDEEFAKIKTKALGSKG